jgi:Ca2+-transporting ATPase
VRAAAAPLHADIPPATVGLSSEEAAAQLAADGPNELPSGHPRTLLDVAIEVVREPMLLLLVATGSVYLLLGDLEEAVALVAAIGVVIGISLYQAQKTEHALEALRDLSSPRALVIRDGAATRIPGREVVRGDQLILREGDRVPADALIVSSTNLGVDESLLTGESVAVVKGDRDTVVYSGTLVVRGAGVARVHATGIHTELGKIGATLSRLDVARTSLQIEVGQVVRVLAVSGLGICAIVAVAYSLNQHQWLDGVLAGLTVAISMVPEEFPVVLTVFLALGAWRISRSRVLTRRMPAIETLGAATVLCVDKTGTLTLNRMSVSAIAAGAEVIDVPLGARLLPSPHRTVLETAILASRRDPFDPMERAFADLGERAGVAAPGNDWTLVHEYPLTDHLLVVTQVWKAPGASGYIVAAKGAPEVMRACAGSTSGAPGNCSNRSRQWAIAACGSSVSRTAGTCRRRYLIRHMRSCSRSSASLACRIPYGRRSPRPLTNAAPRASASS